MKAAVVHAAALLTASAAVARPARHATHVRPRAVVPRCAYAAREKTRRAACGAYVAAKRKASDRSAVGCGAADARVPRFCRFTRIWVQEGFYIEQMPNKNYCEAI